MYIEVDLVLQYSSPDWATKLKRKIRLAFFLLSTPELFPNIYVILSPKDYKNGQIVHLTD